MKTKKILHKDAVLAFDLEDLSEMVPDKTYKVVQVVIGGKPQIIFGYTDTYHCEILEVYLSEKGIPFESVELPATKVPGPAPFGAEYQVVGAGRACIKGTELRFFDKSIGYKMGPDTVQIEQCKKMIEQGIEAIALGYKSKEQQVQQPSVQTPEQPVKEDIPMLEEKLELLHLCLVPSGFEDADKIVERMKLASLKYGAEQVSKIELMAKEYVLLKEFGKSGNAFEPKYISKLTEIRDILLD